MLWLASFVHPKAKLWIDGRRSLLDNIPADLQQAKKLVWFHCASLGEFEQGRPLMEQIKRSDPDVSLVLTFYSPSGYEIRKNYSGADYVCYLPLDSKRNTRRFIGIIRPSLVIFVKYEFWYNYLNEITTLNIPLYLVSAIFRENQPFFKWYGGWYRKMLLNFNHIFVQDKTSLDLLDKISIKDASLAGDTRFDRVAAIVQDSIKLEILDRFKGESKILVAGSTWLEDEELLAAYFNQSGDKLKFVIAPHEIDEDHLQKLESILKVKHIRYSRAKDLDLLEFKVLLIDNIGYLSSIYHYGDAAYIGGAFKTGLHNVLEPAAHGVPVVFGPEFKKFREAVDLLQLGGAFSITNLAQLSAVLDQFFTDVSFLNHSSEIARQYVKKNCGATQRIDLNIKSHYLD